jgi:DNA invertase Pin-like site-specific DNA recombinase
MQGHKLPVGLLVRISEAEDDDTAGVDRQEVDGRKLAERLTVPGWDGVEIVRVYVENDTTAYKRKRLLLPDGSYGLRVERPEFRAAVNDLTSGAVRGLIAYDLDRVARDPRDLEDLIDAVEQTNARTWAVTGSLDLSNDAGITMARVMVAVANKSSRDSSRRIKRKHEELAEAGQTGGGGIRPYGRTADRKGLVPEEVAVIHEMVRRVLGTDDTFEETGEPGDSLNSIAQDFNARGIPTVRGSEWQHRTIHAILTGGHIAGLRRFRGEIVGQADWPVIIDRDVWDRVQIALAGRSRAGGNQLRKWLSGIVLCGQCGKRLWGMPFHGRRLRPEGKYQCMPRNTPGRSGCGGTAIDAEHAHNAAEALILAYLRQPDVIEQLTAATSGTAVAQARKAVKEDEAQLKELATLWGQKIITMAEYLAARKEIDARIEQWRHIVRQGVPGIVRKLLSAKSLEEAWEPLTPVQRREVARVVFPHGIEIVPPKRQFGFDPDRLLRLKEPRKLPE